MPKNPVAISERLLRHQCSVNLISGRSKQNYFFSHNYPLVRERKNFFCLHSRQHSECTTPGMLQSIPSSAQSSSSTLSSLRAPFQPTRVKAKYNTPSDDLCPLEKEKHTPEHALYSAVIPEGYAPSVSSSSGTRPWSNSSVVESTRMDTKCAEGKKIETELPSAREIHDVILKAHCEGDFDRIIRLFTGALELQCIPFTQTYELAVWSVMKNGGFKALISLMDRICTTPASISSFMELVERIWVLRNSNSNFEKNFLQVISSEKELKTFSANSYPHQSSYGNSTCLSLPLKNHANKEDFFYLMEEALHRHVLLPHRLRLGLWRSLHQNREEKKMLQLYRRVWELWGTHSETKKKSSSVGIEVVPSAIIRRRFSPIPSFFSFFFLDAQEARLLQQAAATTGDIEAALLIGHHYIQSTSVIPSKSNEENLVVDLPKESLHSTQSQRDGNEKTFERYKEKGSSRNSPSCSLLLLSHVPPPDSVLIAAFGTAFFKYHADHLEEPFAKYFRAWKEGMDWLAYFPSSDVAMTLQEKMKAVARTYGKTPETNSGLHDYGDSMLSLHPLGPLLSPEPTLYSLGKEHVLQLLAWSRQLVSSVSGGDTLKKYSHKSSTSTSMIRYLLNLAPEVQQKVKALRLSLAPSCEIKIDEIKDKFSYLYILEEHENGMGKLSFPLSVLAISFSIAFPALGCMIWEKYPSSWWNSTIGRGKNNEEETPGWAFLIDFFLLSANPDDLLLSPSEISESNTDSVRQAASMHHLRMQFIKLGTAFMSKMAYSITVGHSRLSMGNCYRTEEEIGLAIEKKRDILNWVSEILIQLNRGPLPITSYKMDSPMRHSDVPTPLNSSPKSISSQLIPELLQLLCVTSSSADKQYKQCKSPRMYVNAIMEEYSLALYGLDIFFQRADSLFQYSSEQVLESLCHYGVEQMKNVCQAEIDRRKGRDAAVSSQVLKTQFPAPCAVPDVLPEDLLTFWGMVLAYYLQCERRCMVTSAMTETLERCLHSSDLLFFAQSYAHMMKEWNGDVGPYRRLVWPLLLEIDDYSSALEIWSTHLEPTYGAPTSHLHLPSDGKTDNFSDHTETHHRSNISRDGGFSELQRQRDWHNVYKCKIKLSEKWVENFLLTEKNKPRLEEFMLELTSLYEILCSSSECSRLVKVGYKKCVQEREELSISFLTRPSTERALLYLFEGTDCSKSYQILRRMINVFHPLLDTFFASSSSNRSSGQNSFELRRETNERQHHCSSVLPSLMFHFRLEDAMAGKTAGVAHALCILDEALSPFENYVLHHDSKLSLNGPCFPPHAISTVRNVLHPFLDFRHFMFGVHCLARHAYYGHAYSFLQRLLVLKRRWEEKEKETLFGVGNNCKVENALHEKKEKGYVSATDDFEKFLLLPNQCDRRHFEFGNIMGCMLSSMIPMFEFIASQLAYPTVKIEMATHTSRRQNNRGGEETPFRQHYSLSLAKPVTLQCHDLCLSILFFIPLVQHPGNVLQLVSMLHRWRNKNFDFRPVQLNEPVPISSSEWSEDKSVHHSSPSRNEIQYGKLLSAGAGRIGFRLLNECHHRGIAVPLSLVEVASSQRFLTKSQYLKLLFILQSSVVPSKAIKELCFPTNLSLSTTSSKLSSFIAPSVSSNKDLSITGTNVQDSFLYTYSSALWRVVYNLHALRNSHGAVEALRSIHPFHFPLLRVSAASSREEERSTSKPSDKDSFSSSHFSRKSSSVIFTKFLMPTFSLSNILSMVNCVSTSIRRQAQTYQSYLSSPIESTSCFPAQNESLRKRILRFVELKAPREAFMLLLQGLEQREKYVSKRIKNSSSPFTTYQSQTFKKLDERSRRKVKKEEDFEVDARLISMVLQIVGDHYSWRTTVRCWTKVHELLPYFWWKVSWVDSNQNDKSPPVDKLMEAFHTLLNSMTKPHSSYPSVPFSKHSAQYFFPLSLASSTSELLEIIEMGIVQFGLPLMAAHGPASQTLIKLLSSQKTLTIADRLYCKEWLTRMRDYFHERKVVNHIQKICEGIQRGEGNTFAAHPASLTSFPRDLSSSSSFAFRSPPCLPSTRRRSLPVSTTTTGEHEKRDEQMLAFLAPMILFSRTHQLEMISKKFFNGRLRSFELKPFILGNQPALLQHLKNWNSLSHETGGRSTFPEEMLSLREELVEQLSQKHLVLVHISQLLSDFRCLHIVKDGIDCHKSCDHQHQRSEAASHIVNNDIIRQIVLRTFNSLISFEVAAQLWAKVRNRVVNLAQHRWNAAVEAELCQQVWQRGGTPPHSLSTAPKLTRRQIEHYWSVYHSILLPEAQLDASELCCLAYYVPELITLHNQLEKDQKGYQEALWELAAVIQTSHFTSHSVARQERSRHVRQPRSVRVIHAVLHRGRKTLVQLHHQLEMDARGTRYLFYCYGGPRHHQDYVAPSPALNALRCLYGIPTSSSSTILHSLTRTKVSQEVSACLLHSASSRSSDSTSYINTIPSRKELILMVHACGSACSTETERAVVDMDFYTQSIWEAVLRDQLEAPKVDFYRRGSIGCQQPPSASTVINNSGCASASSFASYSHTMDATASELLKVVHECCEKIRLHHSCPLSSVSPISSWLLGWHERAAKKKLLEETAMPQEGIVKELLRSIRDPVVASTGMLHTHFAWYGTDIPVELSHILIEHIKFVIHHSVPRLRREGRLDNDQNVQCFTHFFKPHEDDFYAQQPLLDLVALWRLFSLLNVWKYIHVSQRNAFWYLLSPSPADIEALPSKAKKKKNNGEKNLDI